MVFMYDHRFLIAARLAFIGCTMSDMKSDDAASQVSLDVDVTEPAPENLDHSEGSAMPSPQEEVRQFFFQFVFLISKHPSHFLTTYL